MRPHARSHRVHSRLLFKEQRRRGARKACCPDAVSFKTIADDLVTAAIPHRPRYFRKIAEVCDCPPTSRIAQRANDGTPYRHCVSPTVLEWCLRPLQSSGNRLRSKRYAAGHRGPAHAAAHAFELRAPIRGDINAAMQRERADACGAVGIILVLGQPCRHRLQREQLLPRPRPHSNPVPRTTGGGHPSRRRRHVRPSWARRARSRNGRGLHRRSRAAVPRRGPVEPGLELWLGKRAEMLLGRNRPPRPAATPQSAIVGTSLACDRALSAARWPPTL